MKVKSAEPKEEKKPVEPVVDKEPVLKEIDEADTSADETVKEPEVKEPAVKKSYYICRTNIRHNGKKYVDGAKFPKVEDSVMKALLQRGDIELREG